MQELDEFRKLIENPETLQIPVMLTKEQISALEVYLLISTRYRKDEAKACRELGSELNDDGQLKYPNIAANADWWDKTIGIISSILDVLGPSITNAVLNKNIDAGCELYVSQTMVAKVLQPNPIEVAIKNPTT